MREQSNQPATNGGGWGVSGWQRANEMVGISHASGGIIQPLLLLLYPATQDVGRKLCLISEPSDAWADKQTERDTDRKTDRQMII